MKIFFITFGFLAFVITTNVSALAINEPCLTEHAIAADEAFAQMVLYGDRSTKWPTNNKEITALCSNYKKNDKDVKRFSRNCVKGLPKQVISLVLKGASSMFKRFCLSEDNNDEVFSHSNCGNSGMEHDHKCMDKYVQLTKNCLTLSDDKRLAGACCSFNEFEGCILKRMKSEPSCTQGAIKFFEKQINSIAGSALDLTCTEYKKKPELCIPIMQQMRRKNMMGKSLILPLVEVMNSLANN